jgi:hypothetical protein
MPSTQSQVSAFIARFSPEVASQFRKARAEVRALFPRGFELVYDNYNAFGCGYSTTAKSSGVVVSVVAYPKWVTLFFFYGTKLTDPDGILQGSGSRIRSVRLDPPTLLKSKAVRRLLKQAIAQFEFEFQGAPRLSTHIKSVVAKQLPRRPGTKPKRARAAARKTDADRGVT